MPAAPHAVSYTHLNIILELQKEQPELFGTENVRMMRELLEEGVRQETCLLYTS